MDGRGAVRRGAMWRGGRVENRHHYCDRGNGGMKGPTMVKFPRRIPRERAHNALHGEQMQLISPY